MKSYFVNILLLVPFLIQCQSTIQEKKSENPHKEQSETEKENAETNPSKIAASKLLKAYPGHFKAIENNKII